MIYKETEKVFASKVFYSTLVAAAQLQRDMKKKICNMWH